MTPIFPILPLGTVIGAQGLTIRSSAEKLSGNGVGSLSPGGQVEVLRLAEDKAGNTWAQIGHRQFCAINYQGIELMLIRSVT